MSNSTPERAPDAEAEQGNLGRIESLVLRIGIVIAEGTLAISEKILGRNDENDQ